MNYEEDDEDVDALTRGRQATDSEVRIVSGDSIIHRLPGGQNFDITCIEGFTELPAKCQWYLNAWYTSNMQTTLSAVMSGVSVATVDSWRRDVPNFREAEDTIRTIYTEGLRAVHFTESLHNAKIRGQVLKAMKAEGYEEKSGPKNQTNVLVLDAGQSKAGIASFVKQLKQGSTP